YRYSFCIDLCIKSVPLAVTIHMEDDMCNVVAGFVEATFPLIQSDVNATDTSILKSILQLAEATSKSIPKFLQWNGIDRLIQLAVYALPTNERDTCKAAVQFLELLFAPPREMRERERELYARYGKLVVQSSFEALITGLMPQPIIHGKLLYYLVFNDKNNVEGWIREKIEGANIPLMDAEAKALCISVLFSVRDNRRFKSIINDFRNGK
ncbi:hypothetical protein PROFUN_15974, partial [Planoprotostelium fungivorum]